MDDDGIQHLSYFERGWAYVAAVGWYALGLFIALWFASPYIQEKYNSWKRKRDEQEYAAKYHKDIDFMQQRLSALEASRQRIQEQYAKSTVLAQEKEKKHKEKKIQECASLLEGGGQKLGNGNDNASTSSRSKSKSLRPEYNPLMGDTNKRYRPPKRSCCGKGGCG